MIFSYKYPPIFYKFLSFILIEIILVLCLISIIYFLRYILKAKKKNLYKYKINNYYLNWFFISTYINFFILFLLYFRIKRIYSVDLTPIKNLVITTYTNLNVINFLLITFMFFLVCYIILILIKEIRVCFIKELIKR